MSEAVKKKISSKKKAAAKKPTPLSFAKAVKAYDGEKPKKVRPVRSMSKIVRGEWRLAGVIGVLDATTGKKVRK